MIFDVSTGRNVFLIDRVQLIINLLHDNIQTKIIQCILLKPNIRLPDLRYFLFLFRKTNCSLSIKDEHLYKISDIICLPLTSLAFVINDTIHPESIANVVRQYSPVLKSLCIHSEKEGISSMELFKYQRFPRLAKLCVSKDIVGDSFNFIEIMPKLTRLFLWTKEEEFNWETGVDDIIIKSGALKNYKGDDMYEINIGYTMTDPKAASLLFSWYKNLRVLMMALNDEVIRVVFRELVNLEEIMVFDRHLSDAGITGNPRFLSNESAWKVESQREFPYIGDLKSNFLK